jgi:hypothetical protein
MVGQKCRGGYERWTAFLEFSENVPSERPAGPSMWGVDVERSYDPIPSTLALSTRSSTRSPRMLPALGTEGGRASVFSHKIVMLRLPGGNAALDIDVFSCLGLVLQTYNWGLSSPRRLFKYLKIVPERHNALINSCVCF